MRLISLNLWYGEKSEAIKQFLQDNLGQTDIFCFQEALETEALLDGALPEREFKMREVEKQAFENYKLRTYVNNDIEITSTDEIGADLYESGSAVATEFSVNGHPFMVVNVHGVSRPGEKLDSPGRIRQSEEIIDYLKNKQNMPQIICGDFNLLPLTQGVTMFEDLGYRNLIKDYCISSTRNELAWARYPDGGQLFADYTIVSDLIRVNEFRVPNVLISDHLPMIVDFDI